MTMRKALVAIALAAASAILVTASASGDATPVTHHPLYMPDAQNTANPALQPPPVCCAPVAPPPAGAPAPVNMAYFGGHVQVQPKVYLVFWGWGQAGAFDHTTPGVPTYDPDGAAARMTAFVKAMGGTKWAEVSTQFYETVNGQNVYIQNPTNVFGGVWYDNTNPIHQNVTGLELAQEAQRAVAHFGVTDLHDSQFVIAQPQKYTEAGFNSGAGYCAWHDYTQPQYYPGVEDVIDGQNLGAWYDYSAYENADKCAWVGYTGFGPASTVPGGLNNITGNDGKQYAVQSLWSNNSAGGTGWCAGADDDLPVTG
jgi:hypothetical protein